MSISVAERPAKSQRGHLKEIGLDVLAKLGRPPEFQAIIVRPLWEDGKEVAFYRVNVYVNLPSDGMIQRVKISDSLFVKCNNDKVLTEIGKKY